MYPPMNHFPKYLYPTETLTDEFIDGFGGRDSQSAPYAKKHEKRPLAFCCQKHSALWAYGVYFLNIESDALSVHPPHASGVFMICNMLPVSSIQLKFPTRTRMIVPSEIVKWVAKHFFSIPHLAVSEGSCVTCCASESQQFSMVSWCQDQRQRVDTALVADLWGTPNHPMSCQDVLVKKRMFEWAAEAACRDTDGVTPNWVSAAHEDQPSPSSLCAGDGY